jgi:hypothetical protein
MSKQEDYLQDGLERLESGGGLEASQVDMPGEEKELLRLASHMKSTEWPEQDAQVVNTQRKKLGEFYVKEMNMEPKQTHHFNPFRDWRIMIPFSVGMALLLVCGLFLAVGVGAMRWASERQASAVEGPVVGKFEVQNFKQVEKTVRSLAGNEALLVELRGVVQILRGDRWTAVEPGMAVTINDRLRTGPLSSVKLAFKDGSLARLGPESELSIVAVDARSKGGVRQIVLMQWAGESDHMVAKAPVEGSRYEVQTPYGTGMAKGTQFQTRVSGDQSAWFVSEGLVEVTNLQTAVNVEAGQMTSVAADEEPDDPSFFIAGEGEVISTGLTWVIAGQTFLTDEHTVIIGNPQVGDIVFFQGHLQEDGQRMADAIVLIRRNPVNTFSLTGVVQEISPTHWTVNDQLIEIISTTQIDAGIVISDLVKVDGIILTTGELRATTIHKLEDIPGIPFDFTGVAEEIAAEEWVVSGISITVNTTTTIQAGLVVSDLVRVQGWILPDHSWLAKSISAELDETHAFEFIGKIETINPWKVEGIEFQTREWTEVDEDLEVGDSVLVRGHILPDGTWVAFEIRFYDTSLTTFLVGRVFSMNPWIVGGVQLAVTGETQISGTITVGMLVRVELLLQEDGTQKVISIQPLKGFTWTLGCQEFVVTVVGVEGGEIEAEGWPALPMADDIEIKGDLQAGSIALVIVCFNEDGTVNVSYIFIIDSLELEEQEETEEREDHKVDICHKPNGKNPHMINVDQSAVPAHLGHGDKLGPCNP